MVEEIRRYVLLVGGGSVGSIAAFNLQSGGLADVVVVLRSNYEAVTKNGYQIESCDHGSIQSWRPQSVVNKIPEKTERPFDYIVCSTKNVIDIPPTLSTLIGPAITSGHTVIILVQNGLNIEKPLIKAFPTNIVLSGVSLIGANEPSPGVIHQDFPDTLHIGPFSNPNIDSRDENAAAQDFVRIYNAGGKTKGIYSPEVSWTRWRKLVYNACLNPICAITGLDSGRIRLADGAIEGLVRPAMAEIVAAAAASGHILPDDIATAQIEMDPINMYLAPSMLSDARKGNFIEFENILGEPLREGEALGVPMPTVRVLYHLCQSMQWRNKELRGLVQVPPKGNFVKS